MGYQTSEGTQIQILFIQILILSEIIWSLFVGMEQTRLRFSCGKIAPLLPVFSSHAQVGIPQYLVLYIITPPPTHTHTRTEESLAVDCVCSLATPSSLCVLTGSLSMAVCQRLKMERSLRGRASYCVVFTPQPVTLPSTIHTYVN